MVSSLIFFRPAQDIRPPNCQSSSHPTVPTPGELEHHPLPGEKLGVPKDTNHWESARFR